MRERLPVKRLHPEARLPTRGSPQAAGLDLYSVERVTLAPGARAAVRTGLSVAIPEGFYGRVAPRSGLAVKAGLDPLAGGGFARPPPGGFCAAPHPPGPPPEGGLRPPAPPPAARGRGPPPTPLVAPTAP